MTRPRYAFLALALPLWFCVSAAVAQPERRLPPAVNAPWQPVWTKGSQEACLFTLKVAAEAEAQLGSAFVVSGGGVSVTNTGIDCGIYTNAPECDVPIRLYQSTLITVTGDNLMRVHLDLTAPSYVD